MGPNQTSDKDYRLPKQTLAHEFIYPNLPTDGLTKGHTLLLSRYFVTTIFAIGWLSVLIWLVCLSVFVSMYICRCFGAWMK